MKRNIFEFINEESDALAPSNHLCNKNTPDFIKEALLCLLPLNDTYVEEKDNFIVVNDSEPGYKNIGVKDFNHLSQSYDDVNTDNIRQHLN